MFEKGNKLGGRRQLTKEEKAIRDASWSDFYKHWDAVREASVPALESMIGTWDPATRKLTPSEEPAIRVAMASNVLNARKDWRRYMEPLMNRAMGKPVENIDLGGEVKGVIINQQFKDV